ncbi:hypothetical protein MYAM1_002534 [Malassezia yamatoensis]|uniref:Uncharacterized protein n=1 Tax=Malassezia yamatoensis TaxID=253288 RepID=A0AAJ5Z047_9BASI|nr:hypothetical protein MYAM1_002534 [Malassezia yamatoensis]
MFKRLSRAHARKGDLVDETDDGDAVTLQAALDEDSGSETESESGSESSSEQEADSEQDSHSGEEDVGNEQGEFTVKQALQSPIYLDDEAVGRAQIFRCAACPAIQLRNEKGIEVHQESKAHLRRYSRFIEFAEAEFQREGERVYNLDPRILADLLEEERKAAQKTQEKSSENQLPKTKPASQMSRAERRKQRRASRRDKRAPLQEAYAKRAAGELPVESKPSKKRQKGSTV